MSLLARIGIGALLIAAISIPSAPPPAFGQAAPNLQLGRQVWAQKARCSFCHGWSGDGQGDPFSPGRAANLRETQLEAEQIREVVQCGRPATQMPFHDRLAYSDGRCFGLTEADVGTDKPPRGEAMLQAREIDAVVAYVLANVKGRGEITRAECLDYYGENSTSCAAYR